MPKKYCAYFISAVLLFFLNNSFALALEAKYPILPGLPVITDDSRLPDLIRYFFGLAIFVAGILAVVFLVIGAVRLITSAGNPSLRKDALDAIRGSILGLILIISSFILLRTINPQLITPSLEPLPPTEGIFYVNDEGRRPAPMSEPDTRNIPEGYSQILYDCKSGSDLFLWQFPKTNFEGIEEAFVQTLKCGDITAIGGARSFKMAFKTSGIYYFLKDNCQGYMSEANLSGGQILEPFKDKIKSIKIIDDLTSDARYGVILHANSDPTKGGGCSSPLLSDNLYEDEHCFPVPAVFAGSEVNSLPGSSSGNNPDPSAWKSNCLDSCHSIGAKYCEEWTCSHGRESVRKAQTLTDDVCLVDSITDPTMRDVALTGVIGDQRAGMTYCSLKYGSTFGWGDLSGESPFFCGKPNPICQNQYPNSFTLTGILPELKNFVAGCQSFCNLYYGLPYEGSSPGQGSFSCCKCRFQGSSGAPAPASGAPRSVEIFTWNTKHPETSGNGVNFYSEPWGNSIGARAGIYTLSNKLKDGAYWNYWSENANNLNFIYTGINRPDAYKQMYTNFNRLPGSMIIKGNYLIILTNTSEQYCQTFQKNVNNMKVTEFVATGRFTNDGLQHGLGKNCGEALNVNKANGTVRVTVIPLK